MTSALRGVNSTRRCEALYMAEGMWQSHVHIHSTVPGGTLHDTLHLTRDPWSCPSVAPPIRLAGCTWCAAMSWRGPLRGLGPPGRRSDGSRYARTPGHAIQAKKVT